MAGNGRKLALAAVLGALVFASPVKAQNSSASLAQDLTNCAGAVAAHAGIDVIAYPRGASGEWADVLGGVIEAMNREEGVQGMTGRYAASAARAYWAEQPRDAREAAANECRVRFGRG
jgi:hypothetical protein